MRHKTTPLAALIVCILALSAAVAQEGEPPPREGLQLLRHLPHDPVLVWVLTLDDPAKSFDEMLGWIGRFVDEGEPEPITEKLEEADAKLGFSLRNDLLANLGPELAVAVDLPPIDQIAGAFSSPAQGMELLLGKVGIVVTVRDPKAIDGCLRRLIELAEGRVAQADDLFRIELGAGEEEGAPEEMPLPSFFYGFRGNVLALGASDTWLRDVLDAEPGPGLTEGDDFKRVFSHLDTSPKTLTYLNLPKLAAMVQSSGMLQAMIQADEDASKAVQLFLSPEFVGVGIGATSVEVDGGVRTTTFAPSALGGGALAPGMIAAIAIPNLLNAIDRGKQKRTMADMRSIGTVCEAFSIDNERYPGPTEGWVQVDAIAEQVEPVYIRTLPRLDGWGRPILFWSNGTSYRILSRGKDGEEDQDWSEAKLDEPVETQSFDLDIVFADGMFVVYPEGKQQ